MISMMFSSLFTSSNIAAEDMLYTESDLEKSMDKIETIHFHQVFIGFVFCIIDFVCTF